MNHHTLSDFLRQEGEMLDALLSQTIWALHRCGAVSFGTLLVDGTRADARASADSFHDERGLADAVSRKLAALRSRGAGETARQRAERELLGRQDAAVAMLRARQESVRARGGFFLEKGTNRGKMC